LTGIPYSADMPFFERVFVIIRTTRRQGLIAGTALLQQPKEHSRMFAIRSLGISFFKRNRTTPVMKNVSFDVPEGSLVSIVGPSGCGKTSLLRCMAGLDHPASGEMFFKDAPVTAPCRGVTMVFQDYGNSLFPWKTVLENVLFGMKGDTQGRRQKIDTAKRHLESVGLDGHDSHHPWELSGGMQQRLAIARALACGAECLLMDEPFASLDAQTRADLEDLLLTIWTRRKLTVVFVTHDVDEAIYLSDRILVLGGTTTSVQGDIENTLPRPRHQLATRATPLFSDYRGHVHAAIASGADA
jgi:NitT/TauT family transport system ATP-binding protein